MQSSALPLGHAADWESEFPSADRISHRDRNVSLLFLSNGHGEDLIALRVLEALHTFDPQISLEVLPLVGKGTAFGPAISAGWLRRVGPSMRLPSGGFGNQSLRGLIADFAAGLLQITWHQWLFVRSAARTGQVIVAVGDVLPLFFAWVSGKNYGFIGTPKSDYTWRSGPGQSLSDLYHRLKGTEWDPWECALMRSSRCKMVAVRDHLTARGLKRHGVTARAPGNPMMDGLKIDPLPENLELYRRLLLLCGSRMPESIKNFKRLLEVVEDIDIHNPFVVFVPIGAQPSCELLSKLLSESGYLRCNSSADHMDFGAQHCWMKGQNFIFLGPGQFFRWVHWAEVGLANAGTATEQLVGLGIPALSLPGSGPQFKYGFAFRQSRLLGGAVVPCESKESMVEKLLLLLRDNSLRKQVGSFGTKRMGSPGGSSALAALVMNLLLGYSTHLENTAPFKADTE